MLPLSGLRIVVTRAAHQAEELARPLRELGAEVILLPVIDIGPPSDPAPLRQAAQHWHEYDWVIFTSKNAVEAFANARVENTNPFVPKIAAIGPATARAVQARGWPVALTPEEYIAESLTAALGGQDLENKRILIPSAAVTREIVPDALRERGAQVEVVEAYRNVLPNEAIEQAADVFREPLPDWVSFASGSAVTNVCKLAGIEVLAKMKILTIGPATSAEVRKHNLEVTVEAAVHSVAGMVEALIGS